jgi:hypothetical protein
MWVVPVLSTAMKSLSVFCKSEFVPPPSSGLESVQLGRIAAAVPLLCRVRVTSRSTEPRSRRCLSAPPMLHGLSRLAHRMIAVLIDKSGTRFEDGATEFQPPRAWLGPESHQQLLSPAVCRRKGRLHDAMSCSLGCSCIAGRGPGSWVGMWPTPVRRACGVLLWNRKPSESSVAGSDC